MKFGIMFANTAPAVQATMGTDADERDIEGLPPEAAATVALAQAAEAAGFDSLWTVEHVVVPKGYQSTYPYDPSGKMPGGREDFDIPDPLIWLAYVAAKTKSIRLATGVMILPQRNPGVLAKEVATLDRLSGGRVTLGIGVGWLEEEFDALGVPFARRGKRTDEYIEALRALWTQECASYNGEFVNFNDVYSRPQPAQGSVPVHVGGHSKQAAQRAGRLGDGFFPGEGDLEKLGELIAIARQAASDAGRDPSALEITGFGGPPEHIAALVEMGVSRAIIPPNTPENLAAFGENVIAQFKA